MFLPRFLAAAVVLSCLAAGAAQLPDDEVEALREIGKTMGKRDWNFTADPCGGLSSGWITDLEYAVDPNFANNITCNCTFHADTLCHVTRMILRGQNLPGTLPPQLHRLPFLVEIDFARNYLSGPIPPQWGFTKLVNVSLLGNRLTGPIPKEIGNITTLVELNLEVNQLSGSLPPELGNLPTLSRLLLTSNNFTGEIPPSLGKVPLLDLRISDNQFTGPIPKFIMNWTNLVKLIIQGSGLSGPIPSEIGLLTKLTDLRISDLNGGSSPFPPVNTLTSLSTLVLRSCNIDGPLPDNVNGLAGVLTMDLSFNKITGPIPESFKSLKEVDRLYLTGNLINGSVPPWMLQDGESIDLSYNKFTEKNAQIIGCESRSINLFASSAQDHNSGSVSCLAGTCEKTWYSLHINCGGEEEFINETIKYEGDTNTGKSSLFFQGGENWAFSNTGNFMDNVRSTQDFIVFNSTPLSFPNPELYTTARISPISLAYYAYCMGNGKYTLSLHFSEIVFTDDNSYKSLGRRIFDVYVQGKLELKDFNIADAAGGIGKPLVKKFPISVTTGTIEIRLFWAGKGTNAIPIRGVYGPLISAISVDPDFVTPPEGGRITISSGPMVGAVVGTVVVVVFFIILVLGVSCWRACLPKKSTVEHELKGLNLETGSFSLKHIKAATKNFDAANKIGEGGFGPVYKGVLGDGTVIAVKQLSSKSKQGNREFLNEIGMISALQHPNLVKLYGCCIEGDQLLLIYEYLENNSLARALFGPEKCQLNLDWQTRHKICVDIAKGLAYLHEESRLKIIHRDIKATNVLLDKDLNPKISDFGLAKLHEEGNTHISTRIAGTYGYMAPEYAMRGHLTDKADIYSFGIVALEIVGGQSNTSFQTNDDCVYLLDHANSLHEKGSLLELVDPQLGSEFDKKEAMAMINTALQCTNIIASNRPAMSLVVSMLEGKVAVKEVASDPSVSKHDVNAVWSQMYCQRGQTTNEIPKKSTLTDGPGTGSSSTGSDVYNHL